MPDIVVHNRMGRSVYKKLPTAIADEIDREIFRLGLLGPDPYASYRFFSYPFRGNIHRRMTEMHRTKTADFLAEMAKHSQSKEMFSYLAGFLCHYALDSTAHPYINAISDNRGYMHLAVEHRLGRQELDRLGMKLSDKPISKGLYVPFLPASMRNEFEAVLKNVYGWDDSWTKFREAYHHFRMLYCLAEDPWGFVDVIFRHVPHRVFHGKVAVLSYRSNVCENMSFEEFVPLRRKAARKAFKLIEAAYAFKQGEIDEYELRKVIGNRDYNGK